MQFKNVVLFALPVFAAPTNLPVEGDIQTSELVARADASAPVVATLVADEAGAQIEKRQVISGMLTQAATDIGTEVARQAIQGAITLIKDISNWTKAREEFTKATVAQMWAENPDPKKYAAAICNNVGYTLKNGNAGAIGKVSVELKKGSLHTNYDCFYLEAGNTFSSTGDGGYINLATRHLTSCSFTKGTKKTKPSLAC
ncbi:hypothetical protein MAPG_01701 [Magnaporthiopsis poae ATCC 64411]|uniref:DUF7888 domain-containing protein n=1 Tax=Magnaporthiopsis poae (strain ATCC 64411 / 73-15) TaxID=644358 RepID=A0A0C4DPD7_MAGP6|nr:hypothetical protein MAPG_01701 [Magnaporthiopsis poae ATCC 64411]